MTVTELYAAAEAKTREASRLLERVPRDQRGAHWSRARQQLLATLGELQDAARLLDYRERLRREARHAG